LSDLHKKMEGGNVPTLFRVLSDLVEAERALFRYSAMT
jgi:hypothetical protein